jgi:hypothetical protein
VTDIEHKCILDDCQEDADCALQARWPDGQMSRREVCVAHIARGVESLLELRGPDAGEPIITRVRWSTEWSPDQLTDHVSWSGLVIDCRVVRVGD